MALARHALSVTLELGQFAQDLLVLGVLTRGERGGRHGDDLGGSRRWRKSGLRDAEPGTVVRSSTCAQRRARETRAGGEDEEVSRRDLSAHRARAVALWHLARRDPPRASPPSPKLFHSATDIRSRLGIINRRAVVGTKSGIRLCSSLDARRSFFASADRSPRSALAAWRRASAR